jgi:Phytanoyl-CoA dioxygenase (PhyH)
MIPLPRAMLGSPPVEREQQMPKTRRQASRVWAEGDLETQGYAIYRQPLNARDCRQASTSAYRAVCVDREGDVPSPSEAGRLWQPHVRPEWSTVTEQALAALAAGGLHASLELSQLQVRIRGGAGEPWHQDTAFFGRPGDLSCVVWIALTPLGQDSGLHVQPGSHTDPIHVHRDELVMSTQGRKVIETLPDRPSVALNLESGDVLIFLPNLIHRVTANTGLDYTAAIVGYLR